jgi:hypothetical protein
MYVFKICVQKRKLRLKLFKLHKFEFDFNVLISADRVSHYVFCRFSHPVQSISACYFLKISEGSIIHLNMGIEFHLFF